jgi:hypothetical protein
MAAGLSGNHGRVPPQHTASVGVGSLGEASHLHGSMGLGSDGPLTARLAIARLMEWKKPSSERR